MFEDKGHLGLWASLFSSFYRLFEEIKLPRLKQLINVNLFQCKPFDYFNDSKEHSYS